MANVDLLAVALAGFLAFGFSSIYFSPRFFGRAWHALDPAAANATPGLATVGYEILRTYAVTFALAELLALGGARTVGAAVGLGLWAWAAFSALSLAGAILWQRLPPKLAAIHAGESLLKTLLVVTILGSFHQAPRRLAVMA